MISLDVAKRLAQALRPAKPDVAETSGGVVTRLDNDGTVWVQLHGADEDTPCTSRTAAVHVGDAVTVTIDGGSARVDGNVTRPATDDERADEAHDLAAQAVDEVAEVRETATATARLTAIANGIAEQAQAVADAINQHFFADTNGVHVTEAEGDPTTEHNILINSLGLLLRAAETALVSITEGATAFYDGLAVGPEGLAAHITAMFGEDGFQVGKEDDSHLVGDYHSLQLIDRDGGVYFHVSDLRNASGLYETTETFTGNGTQKLFPLTYAASSNDYTVKVDGAEVTSGISKQTYQVIFTAAPSDGAVVTVEYATTSDRTKAYTLGTRALDSYVGAMSFAEGINVTASGQGSHAEGSYTQSTNEKSHAEGISTVASGAGAHSEGTTTVASGGYSHAQNNHTIAAKLSQTALGTYNVEDTATTTTHPDGLAAHGAYALIVGNGTSDSARSNAFAVRWDGTMEAAKPLPVASGGTGSDSFGTVLTDDVSTSVSVPNNSWKALGSVTLTEGDWIVSYNAYFASNATGRRGMLIHSTADTDTAASLRQGGVEVMAVNGGVTMLNGCRVLSLGPASSKTWYLNVMQSSGANLNVTGYIRAFRLT